MTDPKQWTTHQTEKQQNKRTKTTIKDNGRRAGGMSNTTMARAGGSGSSKVQRLRFLRRIKSRQVRMAKLECKSRVNNSAILLQFNSLLIGMRANRQAHKSKLINVHARCGGGGVGWYSSMTRRDASYILHHRK